MKSKLLTFVFVLAISLTITAFAEDEQKMFNFNNEVPAIPAGLNAPEAVMLGSDIVLLGGTNEAFNRELYTLAPQSQQWASIGAVDFDIAKAVSDGSTVYCFAIADTKSQGNKVHKLQLSNSGVKVTALPSLPVITEDFNVTITGNKLYAAVTANGQNHFYILNLLLLKPSWQRIDPWNNETQRAPLIVGLHGEVFLFGQEFALKLAADDSWQQLKTPPIPLGQSKAFPCGHAHILFFQQQSNTMLALHTITGQWVTDWKLPQKIDVVAAVASNVDFTVLGYDKSCSAKAVIPTSKHSWVNYITIAIFLGGMLYVGIRLKNKQKSTDDYFRGGRKIPWWASGLSMFATGASAISLMAMPGKSYATNWLYLGSSVFIVITMLPMSLIVFAPIVRKLDISTSNEYLERHFGLSLRLFGSVLSSTLMVAGKGTASMILPALAISSIFGISIPTSIILMGVITTLYVYLGGLEGVIWTDVLQSFIMLGAVFICILWALFILDMPTNTAMGILADHNKLKSFHWAIEYARPCALAFFLSSLFGSLGLLGDQNYIQRVQCTPDLKETRKAICTQLGVAIPLNAVLFALGSFIFLFYYKNTSILSPAVQNDAIFPMFAAQQLPAGLAGLVVVAVLAATMSTVSSGLNATSNMWVEDFYRRLNENATDKGCIVVGHTATAVVGIVGTLLALYLAQANVTSLWDMFIAISGMLMGAFFGTFVLGVFTTKGNCLGAICGIIASLAVTIYLKNFTNMNVFYFAPMGTASCIIVGYLVGLIFPGKPKDITGLTIYTFKK